MMARKMKPERDGHAETIDILVLCFKNLLK